MKMSIESYTIRYSIRISRRNTLWNWNWSRSRSRIGIEEDEDDDDYDDNIENTV